MLQLSRLLSVIILYCLSLIVLYKQYIVHPDSATSKLSRHARNDLCGLFLRPFESGALNMVLASPQLREQ